MFGQFFSLSLYIAYMLVRKEKEKREKRKRKRKRKRKGTNKKKPSSLIHTRREEKYTYPNMSSPARTSALIAAFLVVVLATKLAAAQSSTPSCVTNIIPCADYLNSTKPPPSCCTPLLQAVTEQLDCLCNLYANPELLKTFGINITQALLLPKACGISSDISACKAVAPSSSSLPPPGVPGGNNGNGVDKIAFTGLSSLFILGASLMIL